MKIIVLMFFLSFATASDQAIKKTNETKSGAQSKNVNRITSADKDWLDFARPEEYKVIMGYIHEARKCSGYEN